MTEPTTIITDEQRRANVAANQANAVTGIYGPPSAGKSNLLDTAAEYAYEVLNAITLVYTADLGGFGNKRLALIRRGIVRVYDPRNHINPFETMELISLGAWPERLIDPERGFAAPDVKLILPRRIVTIVNCPQGHEVTRLTSSAELNTLAASCPECGVQVAASNAQTSQVLVRHRMFKDVGLRGYDSMTALNDWGLSDLQSQSAAGVLPAGSSGGSLLSSADAMRSGAMTFGSSSMAHYGFMQQRTYGWLSNIKTIPDQRVPAIATFHVEMSKESNKRGAGDIIYGPKIAGDARTAALIGWLGNCLHASKEPWKADDQTEVHKLWLTTHIDPRDPAKIPYVAKHRGTPLGMPNVLIDEPGAEPWSRCSLKVFFVLLDEQLKKLDAQAAERYPNAPGVWVGEADDAEDEVMGTVAAATPGAGAIRLASPGRRLRLGAQTATPVATAVAPPSASAAQGSPSGAVVAQTASPGGTVAGSGPAPAVARPAVVPLSPSAPAATDTPGAQPSPPPAPAAPRLNRRFPNARPPVG